MNFRTRCRIYLIEEMDRGLIGFATIHKHSNPFLGRSAYGCVEEIFVAKDFQQRGVGSFFLTEYCAKQFSHLNALLSPTEYGWEFPLKCGFQTRPFHLLRKTVDPSKLLPLANQFERLQKVTLELDAGNLVARRARLDDLDALESQMIDLHREVRGVNMFHSTSGKPVENYRRGLRQCIDFGDSHFGIPVVVTEGREIIATAHALLEFIPRLNAYYAYVRRIYVIPSHRCRGILPRLVDAAIACLRERNVTEVRSLVACEDGTKAEIAERAFEKAGFAPALEQWYLERAFSATAL